MPTLAAMLLSDAVHKDNWVTINGNPVLIGADGKPKAGNPKAYGGSAPSKTAAGPKTATPTPDSLIQAVLNDPRRVDPELAKDPVFARAFASVMRYDRRLMQGSVQLVRAKAGDVGRGDIYGYHSRNMQTGKSVIGLSKEKSAAQYVNTMAHELQHARQMNGGQRGDTSRLHGKEYDSHPMEIDANRVGREAMAFHKANR